MLVISLFIIIIVVISIINCYLIINIYYLILFTIDSIIYYVNYIAIMLSILRNNVISENAVFMSQSPYIYFKFLYLFPFDLLVYNTFYYYFLFKNSIIFRQLLTFHVLKTFHLEYYFSFISLIFFPERILKTSWIFQVPIYLFSYTVAYRWVNRLTRDPIQYGLQIFMGINERNCTIHCVTSRSKRIPCSCCLLKLRQLSCRFSKNVCIITCKFLF